MLLGLPGSTENYRSMAPSFGASLKIVQLAICRHTQVGWATNWVSLSIHSSLFQLLSGEETWQNIKYNFYPQGTDDLPGKKREDKATGLSFFCHFQSLKWLTVQWMDLTCSLLIWTLLEQTSEDSSDFWNNTPRSAVGGFSLGRNL